MSNLWKVISSPFLCGVIFFLASLNVNASLMAGSITHALGYLMVAASQTALLVKRHLMEKNKQKATDPGARTFVLYSALMICGIVLITR